MALSPDVSDLLFDHALATRYEDLSPTTVTAVRRQVLDTLGAAIAGVDSPGCRELWDLVRGWGGDSVAPVIGYGDRVPAAMAALINGCTARAVELDDVHERALTHSSATIVPVVMAVGSARGGISGRDLITAVAVGNDLAVRLALAARRSFGAGVAPRTMSLTYQTATLAGAIAAAKAADESKDVMADAFGSAYSQVAGNLQGLKEGTLGVRVQQGIASFAAVLAWELGRRGVTGGRANLEGAAGWFTTFHNGQFDWRSLVDGLGSEFAGNSISIKPFACCKYGHNAITAAAQIAAHPGFHPSRVARIVVTVCTQDLWDLLCEPLSLKADPVALAGPDGMALAQFSLPFMIAAALVNGDFTTSQLTPAARADPTITRLLPLIEIVNLDRDLTPEDLPEPAEVHVVLEDGTEIEARSTRPLGHPDNPMTDEQIAEKFRWCAQALAPATRERIIQQCLALESVENSEDLIALTRI